MIYLGTYETLIDLVGRYFDLTLTENWLGGFKSKNRVLTKWCIEDPKSNVLDISKKPTKIVLRASMLEDEWHKPIRSFLGVVG